MKFRRRKLQPNTSKLFFSPLFQRIYLEENFQKNILKYKEMEILVNNILKVLCKACWKRSGSVGIESSRTWRPEYESRFPFKLSFIFYTKKEFENNIKYIKKYEKKTKLNKEKI